MQVDNANILEKAKAKKPLTRYERERFETIAAQVPDPIPADLPAPAPTVAAVRARKSATIATAVTDLASLGVHVTKEDLRQHKRDGAPGFEASGRVNLDLLLPWLRTHAAAQTPERPRNKQVIDIEIAEEKLKEWKRNNAVADALYVPRVAVITSNRRLAVEFKKLFRRARTEGPAAVAGKEITEARAWFERFEDQTLRTIQSWENEWPV